MEPLTIEDVQSAVAQLAKSRAGRIAMESVQMILSGDALDGFEQEAVITLLQAAWYAGLHGSVVDTMANMGG